VKDELYTLYNSVYAIKFDGNLWYWLTVLN